MLLHCNENLGHEGHLGISNGTHVEGQLFLKVKMLRPVWTRGRVLLLSTAISETTHLPLRQGAAPPQTLLSFCTLRLFLQAPCLAKREYRYMATADNLGEERRTLALGRDE